MSGALEPGFLDRLPVPPRRVVLFRSSRLGDFVCATPAFRALRAALPDAEITLIALPFARDLVARCPYLDRMEAFPGFPGIAEQAFDARRALRFIADRQAEAFDLAVQMHGSGVYSNPFTLLLGARRTVGFIRRSDDPGRLDAAFPFAERAHEVRRLLDLMEFLGVPPRGEGTEFLLLPSDRDAADLLLSGAGEPLIGLHPGALDDFKRWPLDRFAAAGREVRRRLGGVVVLIGGAEQVEAGAALEGALGHPCLNLTGRTPLGTLGAVIARLSVLITNDSGPAHVAYALDVPTVTIFGGTDPAMWGPPAAPRFQAVAPEVPCRPCDAVGCRDEAFRCLQQVDVEAVTAAALRAIDSRSAVESRTPAPAGAR